MWFHLAVAFDTTLLLLGVDLSRGPVCSSENVSASFVVGSGPHKARLNSDACTRGRQDLRLELLDWTKTLRSQLAWIAEQGIHCQSAVCRGIELTWLFEVQAYRIFWRLLNIKFNIHLFTRMTQFSFLAFVTSKNSRICHFYTMSLGFRLITVICWCAVMHPFNRSIIWTFIWWWFAILNFK